MNKLKILVPVDFSDQSDFAIGYASNFLDKFNVEILFLHVMEITGFADVNREGHFDDMMGINTEMLEIKQETAQKKLKALHEKESTKFPSISSHLKLGPLTETIISFSHHRKVDMILMGTKGADNLKAWFSGSQTQIVARRSEIPVLTVMCDRSHSAINNILFISDFNDLEIAPDPVIAKFAEAFNAKLHFLCIQSEKKTDDKENCN